MDTASQFSERAKSLVAVIAGAAIYALLGLLMTSPERNIRLIAALLLGWGIVPILMVYDPDMPQIGLLVLVLVVLGGLSGKLIFHLWYKQNFQLFVVGFFILNSCSFIVPFLIDIPD